MVADKQNETKAPPAEAGKAGVEKKAGQALHGQVREIHAGGNLKPNAADVAKGNATVDQHFGKVAIADHGKQSDHPNSSKPEVPKPEAGMWDWVKSKTSGIVDSAEHMGANAISSTEHLVTRVEKAADSVSAAAHSDTVHNLVDVGETLAQGVGDSAKNAWHGIEHGVEAAGKGIHDGAVWAEHNPGKAVAIGVGAVAVVATIGAVEFLSGGLATPAIAAASAWLTTGTAASVFEGLGIAAAGTATVAAGLDVAKHGEIATLMNQQHESPEKVAEAHKMLKNDTGDALLGDLTLAGGQALKWGVKGIAALRAGSAIESTAGAAATAPGVEAVAPGAAAVVPDAADNPLLTRTENVVERLAEEAVDAGAVTASATSLAPMLDKCRQIAGVAGTAYQHVNDAGSTIKTIKNALGLVSRGYAVASPDKHTVSPEPGQDGVPDEPTKH